MSNCPTCNQPMPGTKSDTKPDTKPGNIEIRAKDKFQQLCNTILLMPGLAKEPEMRSFLEDIPSKLRRYNSLTAGQARFFKAIHKKATDTWPPDWSEFQKEDGAQTFAADDDEAIPF